MNEQTNWATETEPNNNTKIKYNLWRNIHHSFSSFSSSTQMPKAKTCTTSGTYRKVTRRVTRRVPRKTAGRKKPQKHAAPPKSALARVSYFEDELADLQKAEKSMRTLVRKYTELRDQYLWSENSGFVAYRKKLFQIPHEDKGMLFTSIKYDKFMDIMSELCELKFPSKIEFPAKIEIRKGRDQQTVGPFAFAPTGF